MPLTLIDKVVLIAALIIGGIWIWILSSGAARKKILTVTSKGHGYDATSKDVIELPRTLNLKITMDDQYEQLNQEDFALDLVLRMDDLISGDYKIPEKFILKEGKKNNSTIQDSNQELDELYNPADFPENYKSNKPEKETTEAKGEEDIKANFVENEDFLTQ